MAAALQKLPAPVRSAVQVVCRCVAAILGGYAATSAFIAFFGRLLPHIGLPAAEAVMLGVLVGLVFYIGLVIWIFGAQRWGRVCAGLAGLTAALAISVMIIPVK